MQTKSGEVRYPSCENAAGQSLPFKACFSRPRKMGVLKHALLLPLWFAFALAGCAASGPKLVYEGPPSPADVTTSPWAFKNDTGAILKTRHYDIYTTVDDPEVRSSVAQVMEGALAEYQKIAPGVPVTDKPMECYLFANRQEWAEFTKKRTGPDAGVYLQINRGGYTIRDWYVAYYVGEAATCSVAAHEGWHQFVSRHFKGRMPPFLEEGISTMFEDIQWKDDLPRWNLGVNRNRVQSLRHVIESNSIYPLGELLGMHAGNVVNQSGNHIEAFYSESWAFATFLWDADNAKYRPALRQLMSDIADGSVFDPSGVHKNANQAWNPSGVKPMLEHYLGMPLDAIDAEYQKYIRKVAYDDYNAQWGNS